ncbi:MAG TPA: DNA polymerase I [Actinomycetota bacterium]|nr:DNA polymerase I [Actinomycetota bacterium]
MTAPNPEPVLLFDGHSLAYRAFYALPSDLRTSSGQITNAVYGFTSMLIKAIQDLKTQHVTVAFDSGPPLERLAIRPEYKAQRVSAPDEFRQQMGLIHEVLDVLKVPVFEIPNVEADDILSVIATSVADSGGDAVIVTADRDYFQIVRPGIRLMMNRRGISDTVVYDTAAVIERFGFPPAQYLDYAALRGDPSDNIEGVPGVGEKTAARLIIKYGGLDELFENIDVQTPKLKENLLEARDRLFENRDFFRFRGREHLEAQGGTLDISVGGLAMGEWDFDEIRKLFDALEFRVLFDRIAAGRPEAAVAGFEAEVTDVAGPSIDVVLARPHEGPLCVVITAPGSREPATAVAVASVGGAEVLHPDPSQWSAVGEWLSARGIITHGCKEAVQALAARGLATPVVEMDTEIAAYLLEPARGSYGLDELARTYLEKELRLGAASEDEGQQSLSLEEPGAEPSGAGIEVLAVAQVAAILTRELAQRGLLELLRDLEIPLALVLAKVEDAGVRIDVDYLKSLSDEAGDELSDIEAKIYEMAGEPFNIGSPPQLRSILYDKLGLKPGKKTKTGYSTDASVLESLREEHQIVDAILRHREISKLKSTYLDALPPLVDPKTGRVHCHFNQTVAATGRLSSDSPNLQNIPIRTEEGKRIRKAFIPDEGHLLIVADYSQIELRILAHLSKDPNLVDAFRRGEDIHKLSISKALGIGVTEVTSELRSIGKMVSYGVTYGMGAFGLSQRLKIPMDQARTYIDGFFGLYPGVRQYLDAVVEQAAVDGFTTTMLGRRRYVPELRSRNPRVRSLGERQALNAPIQGSAADILKLAMVKTDEALRGFDARMVLTVHDELVFEAPTKEVDRVAVAVKEAMESVVDLDVPLSVDVASGPNWAEAKA